MDPEPYCREVEAYLCRKNDGHLIRIVGPAFDRVCGWAARGVPLRVVFRGIDRHFERYYAKGPRRWPVRIDSCEADVLDAFDGWRRMLGLTTAAATEGAEAESGADASGSEESGRPGRRRAGLATHLDRILERIAARRTEPGVSALLQEVLDRIAHDAALLKATATPQMRGEGRTRILARLGELDRELMTALRRECSPPILKGLHDEAVEQLAPFHERMAEETYRRALDVAVDGLLRERERLPVLAME